jgi:hypothetical protein
MHKMREILRQKWLLGRTHRQTAVSNGTSPGAVGNVLARAGLDADRLQPGGFLGAGDARSAG